MFEKERIPYFGFDMTPSNTVIPRPRESRISQTMNLISEAQKKWLLTNPDRPAVRRRDLMGFVRQ
jgi:hypothetical protein